MFNLPNCISFLRAPLALLFIIDNTWLRMSVIILAMISDCVDGYLARRYDFTSKFGTILDPIMDKLFVYISLAVLLSEQIIFPWQVAAMLSRDAFLFLFLSYLAITNSWKTFTIQSIRWGKVTTAFQFCILLALALHIPFPSNTFYLFICFGILAFLELLQFRPSTSSN